MRLHVSIWAVTLGCLLAAAPAAAHRVDLGLATRAVRAEVEKIGAVERTNCWRARRGAVCVAWWVRMPSGVSCALFFDVRLAGKRFVIRRRFDPLCA